MLIKRDPLIEFKRVYFIRGTLASRRNQIRDPDISGWAAAFIIQERAGLKRIFEPIHFNSWLVADNALEITMSREPFAKITGQLLIDKMFRCWENLTRFKFQADFLTASKILEAMGQTPPITAVTIPQPELQADGETMAMPKGKGKAMAPAIMKPVKRNSKRGKFLEYIMDAGNSCATPALMSHFNMSRSNVLSYLFVMNKDSGIGYALSSNTVFIQIPEEGELWA